MDRTLEFRNFVATLPSQQPPIKKGALSPAVATLQEFHGASSDIARGIHVCSQRLAQLTNLVQSRALFNDPAAEINTLVHSIKQDINNLNCQLDAAQSYVNNKKRQLGAKSQPATHSVQVIGQLKTELLHTTKSFKDVLEQRSSNLKAQNDRKDIFFNKQSALSLSSGGSLKPSVVYKPIAAASPLKPPGGSSSSSSSSYSYSRSNSSSNGFSSSLPRPGEVSTPSEDDAEGEGSVTAPLIAPMGYRRQQGGGGGGQGQQQQQQQLMLHQQDQSYMDSRTSAMQDVEAHIAELGTVFNRLATMLQDQRHLVESVHDNVEDSAENVSRGQLALISTLQALQSNRMLAAKVMGLLFIFIVFFMVFMA